MPRVHVNDSCNILTGAEVRSPRAKAEVTVPRFRANLSWREAMKLGAELIEAADYARAVEAATQ
jgi:hypothetical protein